MVTTRMRVWNQPTQLQRENCMDEANTTMARWPPQTWGSGSYAGGGAEEMTYVEHVRPSSLCGFRRAQSVCVLVENVIYGVILVTFLMTFSMRTRTDRAAEHPITQDSWRRRIGVFRWRVWIPPLVVTLYVTPRFVKARTYLLYKGKTQ